ncbi:EVE domain-containing protein [Thiorhodococcus mannitoliphagus]|uniref:EVE domain-containing protein n=1 Tax=Thiorhodococcus mannitoliphagus TaxID=329406 RepID=A0A6P1DYT8_9GAMM|nr:EVE domain-containing protein [Thiorhodococcus mannitoliphagus]NEX20874.1 EVE domain-containing protein [Thiorhodococcus mannitoliphagus]
MAYWLMKSEPDVFGIDHLAERPDQIEPWDGVRNYQARNMMRDQMRPGDGVLFYHSNCTLPGVVGIAEIATQSRPDPTAFDPEAKYFDPKSDPDNPRWYLVDVRYVRHLKRTITLAELKEHSADLLKDMPLVRKGNRLSIMPVTPEQWNFILSLE